MLDEPLSEAGWRLAETICRLVPRCREDGEDVEETSEISRAKVVCYSVALPLALVAIGALPCVLGLGRRPPSPFLGGSLLGLYLAVALTRQFGGRSAAVTAVSLALVFIGASWSDLSWNAAFYIAGQAAVCSAIALLPYNADGPSQRLGLLRSSRNRRSREFTRDSISSSFDTGLPCFSRSSSHS